MGAKLVTLSGESPFERQCGSMLAAVNERKYIAGSIDEYIELAEKRLIEETFPINHFRERDLFNFIKFTKTFISAVSYW
jgi:hypothetical protein